MIPIKSTSLGAVTTLAGAAAAISLYALSPASPATSSVLATAAAPATSAEAKAPSVVARASSAKTSATPAHAMAASSGSCGGLSATEDAFLQHFYAAHLETSPGQQAADVLSLDQYVKTHTVLVENMLAPLVGGADGSSDAFLQHFNAAHLETSPGQQVADVKAADQYVKTHSVLVENMAKPLAGADTTTC